MSYDSTPSSWATSTYYSKNSRVLYNSKQYYSLSNHTSGASFDSSLWGGYATFSKTGEEKPEFIWIPSYNKRVNHSPKSKTIKFGDGYEQRTQDGINNELLNISLSFDGRDLLETEAILNFLYRMKGYLGFIYTPSAPYNSQKLYVCRNYEATQVFFNNFSITATFDEVVS